MTYKTIGTQTLTVYVKGSHAECVRYVNAYQDTLPEEDKPLRIVPSHIVLESEEAYLERVRKEMALKEIQAEQRRVVAEEERKKVWRQRRQAELEARRALATEKRKQAKIRAEQRKVVWTEAEMAFLLENYGTLQRVEIAKKIGKSKAQVSNQITRLLKDGVLVKRSRTWSKEDDAYLIENYQKRSAEEVAVHIGVTTAAVKNRYLKLREMGHLGRKLHQWTEEEDQYIRENVGVLKAAEIAKVLGLGNSQVRGHIHNMKLSGRL